MSFIKGVDCNPVDSAEANATLSVYGESGNIGDNKL